MPFEKLNALGPERVAKIDDMLTRGLTARQVTIAVQNEWGVWTSDRPDSIKKMLERYRKTDLRAKLLAGVANATERQSAAVLRRKLNALDELNDLVGVQKERFEKVMMRERPTPLLMKQASDEARLLKEMLVELGRLQLETGVLQRAPKKVRGTLTGPDGATQTFEWTQEQEALFKEIGGETGYAHAS